MVESGQLKRRKIDSAFLGLTNVNYNPEVLSEPEQMRQGGTQVVIQFKDDDGDNVGVQISVDSMSSKADLNKMLAEFLTPEQDHTGPQLFQFFLGEKEIVSAIYDAMDRQKNLFNAEMVLPLTFKPEAMFKIRPVTRASSTLEGHSEAILQVAFSPDGTRLASASGDTTVRLWDLATESPDVTCEGHKGWVLFVAFSPDGKTIASGGMDNNILLWDAFSGTQIGLPLKGHKKFITSISWEPLIKMTAERRLASSSKDMTVRIWATSNNSCLRTLGCHTQSVTKVLWGGEGILYSASQDRVIRCWEPDNGILTQQLQGHAHWVNCLALSTDYVLRTGCHDENKKQFDDLKGMQTYALERYNKARDTGGEILVSGSDDLTMFMWQPKKSDKSLQRLSGHKAIVIQVAFSPDGFYFVSASFDKTIKLWETKGGKFLNTFRGHVQSVYQVCWSADSRLLVSGSKDSTLKVWDVQKRKLMFDLPGHADEVYAVDWSPDGERVASGSKDRRLRIWRN